jgi:hypothetical protein
MCGAGAQAGGAPVLVSELRDATPEVECGVCEALWWLAANMGFQAANGNQGERQAELEGAWARLLRETTTAAALVAVLQHGTSQARLLAAGALGCIAEHDGSQAFLLQVAQPVSIPFEVPVHSKFFTGGLGRMQSPPKPLVPAG